MVVLSSDLRASPLCMSFMFHVGVLWRCQIFRVAFSWSLCVCVWMCVSLKSRFIHFSSLFYGIYYSSRLNDECIGKVISAYIYYHHLLNKIINIYVAIYLYFYFDFWNYPSNPIVFAILTLWPYSLIENKEPFQSNLFLVLNRFNLKIKTLDTPNDGKQ